MIARVTADKSVEMAEQDESVLFLAENTSEITVALSGLFLFDCFPGVRCAHPWQRSCDPSDRNQIVWLE